MPLFNPILTKQRHLVEKWATGLLCFLVFWSFAFHQTAEADCPLSNFETTGYVKSKKLNEISGLALGPDGEIWVHNDSGDKARIYQLSPSGKMLQKRKLPKTKAFDWEDMAIEFRPNGLRLILGDIGDNLRIRKNVKVHLYDPLNSDLKTMTLNYGSVGPQDAEGIAIDPRNKDIYILTKGRGGTAYLLRKPPPHRHGQKSKMKLVHQIKLPMTPLKKNPLFLTAMDISPDGRWIVIRNYLQARLWPLSSKESVAHAMRKDPCLFTFPLQQQGESIGFGPKGKSIWTISEGKNQPIYRLKLR